MIIFIIIFITGIVLIFLGDTYKKYKIVREYSWNNSLNKKVEHYYIYRQNFLGIWFKYFEVTERAFCVDTFEEALKKAQDYIDYKNNYEYKSEDINKIISEREKL